MDSWALNDRQKTRLLSLALERDGPVAAPNEDEQKGDLLRDILRCALPLETPVPSAAGATCPSYSVPRTAAEPSLGELLRDRATDLVALRRIKEYAKALGKNAKSGVERDVFLAVYFAAIAAALAYHEEHITGHLKSDMARFFAYYASADWMPNSLRELLQRAAHCGPEAKPNGI